MMQPCCRFEILAFRFGKPQIVAKCNGEPCNPLNMAGSREATKLGRYTERLHGLTKCSTGTTKQFKRIPRSEKGDSKKEWTPKAKASLPSDPSIPNGHEHAACNKRKIRTPSPDGGQSALPCERHKVNHCDLNYRSTRERAKH